MIILVTIYLIWQNCYIYIYTNIYLFIHITYMYIYFTNKQNVRVLCRYSNWIRWEQNNTYDCNNISTLVFIKLFSKAKNGNENFKIWTKEIINKTRWIYLLICRKVKYQRLVNWNKVYISVGQNLVVDKGINIKYLSQIIVTNTYL